MGINDCLLIVVATFFSYLLLAIYHEEKRATERRKQDQGPPKGIEQRSGKDRRRDSLLHYGAWLLRSQTRRLGSSKKDLGN